MCNCHNSPWVQNANNFLSTNLNNKDGRWHTVDFLIRNNHCGIDNRTDIESILNHLRSQRINLNREGFQQTILGELKRQGIVATLVNPGPNGGVFIPCSEDKVRTAAKQILNRIVSEVGNLEGVAQLTSFGNLFTRLKQYVNRIRGKI